MDPGPATTLGALEEGLAAAAAPLGEIRHLCLTHVHLDHAGATGHLVARHPRLTVHVHEDAAPHLVDPERLVASTRRTFGGAHDRLWGEVRPVPAHRIRVWRPGDRGPLPWLRALPTPGHIGHHLAWLDEREGTLAAGDALGILLHPDAPVHPPTPPPGVDLEAWLATLDAIADVGPERAAVAHFGVHPIGAGSPTRPTVAERAGELAVALARLARRVRDALDRGEADADALAFEEEVRVRQARHLDRDRIDRYFDMFAAATDYAGVRRYLEKNPAWRPPEAGG